MEARNTLVRAALTLQRSCEILAKCTGTAAAYLMARRRFLTVHPAGRSNSHGLPETSPPPEDSGVFHEALAHFFAAGSPLRNRPETEPVLTQQKHADAPRLFEPVPYTVDTPVNLLARHW